MRDLLFFKNDGDAKYKFFIGYINQNKLQSPFITITYPKIESILNRSSKALGLNIGKSNYSIKRKRGNEEVDFSLFSLEIKDTETFKIVFKEIERIFVEIAQVFFKDFNKLSKVAELFSNFEPKEIVPYIQGKKLFTKSILILRETQHSKFHEKKIEFYEFLKKQAITKEAYKKELYFFEHLFITKSI